MPTASRAPTRTPSRPNRGHARDEADAEQPAYDARTAGRSRRQGRRQRFPARLAHRLSRADAPLRLSRRRAARRGGQSRQPRRRGRHAVLLLFDRDADAALPGVRRRVRRRAVARLLRHEGEFQPGGDRDAGAARRRRRRGVGRRTEARARGRHSARQDHVLRHRQDRARTRAGARRGHPLHQCRSRSRSSSCSRRSPRRRAARARISVRVNPDVDAKTHAKIATGKAENKFGIPISRAREVYAHRGQAAGRSTSPASTCISAARSPICSRSTMRSRCWPISCARCAPTATRSRTSISAAASAFPIARTTSRRPIPTPTPRWSSARRAGSDCTLIFEPGRLIVGNAGILVTRVLYVKRGEAKTFVIVDAGDERSDPPDALRGASRHPAGAGADRGAPPDHRRRGRPGLRNRAISSRSTAIWPSRSRATCSPS